MARARAIETRLEKLLPSMEEYFTSGFLTRQETQEVARQRSHWEYRLVAKPLLLLDVQNAVAFELGLEKRLANYCTVTKLVLRHRWAVLERMESIYRIGLKHIKDGGEWELLRCEFVAFLKQHNRHSSLSALYGELMVCYPTRSALWVEAAIYEGVEMANFDNGRVIIQQAILTAGGQPEVWSAAFLLELHFADRLIQKLVEEKGQMAESHCAEHDIVKELQAENSALASVVVELALVKAVVEEAFESPACSPTLVQQLLDSAIRFGYAGPVVHALMASAATKMVSALNFDTGDCSHIHSSAHKWTETGVSHFLSTFLRIDMIMTDRGVMGDPSSFLRSGGRSRVATEEERMSARLTSLVAALTLVQLEDVGEAGTETLFSVMRKLRCLAVKVVEELLEELQQLGYAAAVSAVCRLLLLGKRVTVADVERIFCESEAVSSPSVSSRKKGKKPTEQQMVLQASADRVLAALMGGMRENHIVTKKSRGKRRRCDAADDATWRRLGHLLQSADRMAVETATTRTVVCGIDASDVERLLLSQRDLRDGELVADAVLRFLQEFRLLRDVDDLSNLHQLRFGGSQTPLALWKVFCLLEERCNSYTRPPTGAVSDNDDGSTSSSSDDDDVSDRNKKMKVQCDRTMKDTSYAAAGLRFLASVPYNSLHHATEEAERLHGCWALVTARVHTLTQLHSTTRTDFIRCMQHCDDAWVEELRSILRVAHLCDPVPRQVYTEVALPFLEALALVRQGSSSAIRDARDAHEFLLAMYTLSSDINSFLPLVRHLPDQKKANTNVSSAELNATDWARFVAFERDVAKDLCRAKEVAARGRRMTLAPQRLLAMLNAH